MANVAKIAGVSAMTVSRALRDPKIVNADTLTRIQSAIARLLVDRIERDSSASPIMDLGFKVIERHSA